MHGFDWKQVVDNDTAAIIQHSKEIKTFFHQCLQSLKPSILLTGSKKDEFISSVSPKYFESGIRYASVSQFCRDNGLRYPTVIAQLNRGMAPEQILEQQHTSRNTFSAQKSECEYEGQHFLSLSKAAEHFGIQPSYLYALKKKEHLAANETLRLAMERKQAKHPSGTVVPCTINGVEFLSQSDALAYYHIPRATVTSRMQRNHLTFEEALMGMIQKQRRLTPMVSLFDPENVPQRTCGPVQELFD